MSQTLAPALAAIATTLAQAGIETKTNGRGLDIEGYAYLVFNAGYEKPYRLSFMEEGRRGYMRDYDYVSNVLAVAAVKRLVKRKRDAAAERALSQELSDKTEAAGIAALAEVGIESRYASKTLKGRANDHRMVLEVSAGVAVDGVARTATATGLYHVDLDGALTKEQFTALRALLHGFTEDAK